MKTNLWKLATVLVAGLFSLMVCGSGIAAKGGIPGPPTGGETPNNLSLPAVMTGSGYHNPQLATAGGTGARRPLLLRLRPAGGQRTVQLSQHELREQPGRASGLLRPPQGALQRTRPAPAFPRARSLGSTGRRSTPTSGGPTRRVLSVPRPGLGRVCGLG